MTERDWENAVQGLGKAQPKRDTLHPIHQNLHPNLEISREGQIAQKQTQRDDYDRTAKKLQDLQQISECPVPVRSQETNLAVSHGGTVAK